jgi:hypothetical protein
MKVSIKMKAITTVELMSLKSGEVFSFPGETDFYINSQSGISPSHPALQPTVKFLLLK